MSSDNSAKSSASFKKSITLSKEYTEAFKRFQKMENLVKELDKYPKPTHILEMQQLSSQIRDATIKFQQAQRIAAKAFNMNNIMNYQVLIDFSIGKFSIDSEPEKYSEFYGVSEPTVELLSKPQIILLNESIRVQGIIKSIYEDNSELYRVHHRDFEYLIAELLEGRGLKVELTNATRDGGYDILAVHDTGITSNRYLVECKRHREDRPVGVGIVQRLNAIVATEKATKGIIFTSSYFTRDADKWKEKHMPYTMDLNDGVRLLEWIHNYMVEKNRFY